MKHAPTAALALERRSGKPPVAHRSVRLQVLFLFGALGVACRPPPDLVDDSTDDLSLTDVIPRLFDQHEGTTDDLATLIAAMEDRLAALAVPLDGARRDREFSLAPLTPDLLGGIPFPEGASPDDQYAVVVFSRSRHDWDTALTTALEPNQVCIESKTTVYYQRAYTSDDACFRSGSCGALTSDNEVRKELSILANGWYDLRKDFRRFETADGRRVLLARAWLPRIFPLNGNNRAVQTFTVETWIEQGDAVDRMFALWGQLEIGLPRAAMRDLTSNTLDEAMERQDLWNETTDPSTYCRQDRDRPNDRG